MPLPDALLIFTDGSKTGCGAYLVHGSMPVTLQFLSSPQVIELHIVIKVFELYSASFNLISDSQYVVNSLAVLEVVGKVNFRSTIGDLLNKWQSLILSSPFFVQHILVHTGLPGPLAEGNDLVDKAARAASVFLIQTPVEVPVNFIHSFM